MTFSDIAAQRSPPPFPFRHPKRPPTWRRVMLASQDILSVWEDEAFDLEFTVGRLLARMVYVCNSPRAVQYAFSHHHESFERKSPQMRHALEPLLGDGLFISDGQTWRDRRKIIAPIVHISHMGQFAPVMVEAATEVRDRWRGQHSVDALNESALLTAEIICRTVFGRELGRKHARELVEGFSEYQHTIDQIDLMSLLALPDWVPRYRSGRVKRAMSRVHSVLDGIIDDLKGRSSNSDDSVIRKLLDAKDENGAPLSPTAIRNEAAVILMAGHETTANVLAWTWYLLSQTPDVEAKLHAELDTVLEGRSPRFEDVPRLVITRAILDETMRLYPPVPILAREALTQEQFEGHFIPKGSLVMVVPWLLHRHRKLWQFPDHFMPERFLEGSSEPVSKFAYVPFSIGPRNCAGLSFGIVEAVLSLATLAQSFRLRLDPGHHVKPVCRLTLRPANGLPMLVEPRAGARSQAELAPGSVQRAAAGCPFHHA